MNQEEAASVIIVSDSRQLASQLAKFFSTRREEPERLRDSEANVSSGRTCPKCGAGKVLESRFSPRAILLLVVQGGMRLAPIQPCQVSRKVRSRS